MMTGPKSPGAAQAVPRHHNLNLVAVAGWAQAGNRTVGAPAVERVAAAGADDLDPAARKGIGHDAIVHLVGSDRRHRDLLCRTGLLVPGSTGGTGVRIMVGSVPRSLADWMWPFIRCFPGATWDHVLVLVAGTLLSPGRRTVTAALRVMDLDQSASFAVYHRVLSTARWSARLVAYRLLRLLVAAFVRDGPVVIGLDDTIERRWGTKIKARGIYRDPVRSSHGHFVKASGLRWLCVMLLAPIPWAG